MICPVIRAPLKGGDSDGPGSERAGPENAEVSGCIELVGSRPALPTGCGSVAGMLGAAGPTLPGPVQRRGCGRAEGPPLREAVGAGDRGLGACGDAGALSQSPSRLDGEALPRLGQAPSRLLVGLHVDEDAASCGRSARPRTASWGAPQEARAQAGRRHAAAPRLLTPRL